MTDIFLGLAGVLAGLMCFARGYALAREKSAGHRQRERSAPRRDEEAERQRRAMEEEQRAFRALTGYSADIAYGTAAFPWEDEA